MTQKNIEVALPPPFRVARVEVRVLRDAEVLGPEPEVGPNFDTALINTTSERPNAKPSTEHALGYKATTWPA